MMQAEDDHNISDELLEELPPSPKFVYRTLEKKGSLNQSELADQTCLAPGRPEMQWHD